ncbi:hypothetical protein BDQ17DRAFT_1409079 [Cyathus striatus]|nr:hypothetical protein BDQ17DRAFT_1409079 [Cyathus striatus]
MSIAEILVISAMDVVLMLRVGIDVGIAYVVYNKTLYDSHCHLKMLSHYSVYLTSALIAMQTIIWGITIVKIQLMPGNIPIIQVITYDGVWVIVLFWAIYVVTVPFAMVADFSKLHFANVWPLSLLSIAFGQGLNDHHRGGYPFRSDDMIKEDVIHVPGRPPKSEKTLENPGGSR